MTPSVSGSVNRGASPSASPVAAPVDPKYGALPQGASGCSSLLLSPAASATVVPPASPRSALPRRLSDPAALDSDHHTQLEKLKCWVGRKSRQEVDALLNPYPNFQYALRYCNDPSTFACVEFVAQNICYFLFGMIVFIAS